MQALCSCSTASIRSAKAESTKWLHYSEWELPAEEFHGLWDSLLFETALKPRLMAYAATALLFSDRQAHFAGSVSAAGLAEEADGGQACRGIQSHLLSLNRTVLLHGPPGTGKVTASCNAQQQHSC